jgi:hypothetical protein
MRILPLSLLAPALLFSLYGTAHAQSSTQQQICHNGQCWDVGDDIGDECCPFLRQENPMENLLKLQGVTFNWKQNDPTHVGLIAQDV